MRFIFLGLDKKNMDMYYALKKVIGVFVTLFNRLAALVTRVAYASMAYLRRIALGLFFSMKPKNSEQNVLPKSLTETEQQSKLQEYLNTPDGQKLKAELVIHQANQMLIQLLEQYMKQPAENTAERMMLGLAIIQCQEMIEKNQSLLKTLN